MAEATTAQPARAPWWIWAAGVFLAGWPVVASLPAYPFGAGEALHPAGLALRLLAEGTAVLWAARRVDLPRALRASLAITGLTSLVSCGSNLLLAADARGWASWGESADRAVYVASYLMGLAALLLFPRVPLRRGPALAVSADVLVSVGTLGLVSWLLAAPDAGGGEATPQALASVVAQLATVAGLNLVIVLGRAVPSRRAFWWFVAGLAMYVPSIAFELLAARQPAFEAPLRFAYFAGAIPTLVACVFFRSDPLQAGAHAASPRWLLHLNPVALASPLILGAFLIDALGDGQAARVGPLAAGLVAASAALVARLLVTSLENARLHREEREAERRAQAAKMESVGRLAGGIAHEFNNLMATVISTASLGARDAPPGAPAREDFDTIKLAGQRAAALTRQLITFAGRQEDSRRPVDVAAAVARLEPRLRGLAGPAVRLELSAAPAPPALADPAQLWTVLSHLASNAAQAMPSGGTLSVSVRPEHLDAPLASDFLAARPGRYVALSVSDTGAGIAPDVLPRIFEPFFSTRPIFEAKGLGLAEVHGIVAAHGGGLAVETAPGRGSTFTVYLPATGGPDASGS